MLSYAKMGDSVRVAIRAGDILLALERPIGLSARNILHGTIESQEQRSATYHLSRELWRNVRSSRHFGRPPAISIFSPAAK